MPTFLSLPEKASSTAVSVNVLLLTMLAVGFFFAIWIALLAFEAMLSSESKKDAAPSDKQKLPKWWIFGVTVVIIILFFWSSVLYLNNIKVPDNAENVISVTKHWVWKFQHTPDGKGEIDELHVPVGQPVRLIMTSQDTTHNIFIPNFLQQQDILPGKFTAVWFTATKPGEYPFYTTQYCGTGYTKMAGKIIAMEPEAYQAWLSGQPVVKPGEEETPAPGGNVALGEQIFTEQGCSGCHTDQNTPVAPTLHGIYGEETVLTDGSTVTVDDAYLHESIVDPGAKLVEGYNDIMPKNYGADLSEEQIQALIDYIKSLSGVAPEPGAPAGAPGQGEAVPPGTATELSPEAMEIYTAAGCNACHGQKLEGQIGPNLAGLGVGYIKHVVRNGVEGTAMAPYGPDRLSDADLDTLARSIHALSLAATGLQVNPTVAQHLQEAAAAFDAGDMDATKASLEAALAACGQMGGQATLKTMLHMLDKGDTEYLKMRFDILLAGQVGEAPMPEPTQALEAEPTQAPEPTPTEAAQAPEAPTGEGDPVAGEEAFVKNGCQACHTDQDTPVAPSLHGIYGEETKLADGGSVLVDDAYLLESIVDPHAKLVEGYGPVMPPTYANLDPQVLQDIVAYIKSLSQ